MLYIAQEGTNDMSLLLSMTVFLFLLQTIQGSPIIIVTYSVHTRINQNLLTGNEISLLAASAELSPDTYTYSTNPLRQSSASVAIDGDNRKGHAGGLLEDLLKCASTSMDLKSRTNPLKYLLIKMKSTEYISYVRIHLRDGLMRHRFLNGLTVSVSNSSSIQLASRCGNESYNAIRQGQSPFFICMKSAKNIWIVLRNSPWPLQVCEVRAYSGMYDISCLLCSSTIVGNLHVFRLHELDRSRHSITVTRCNTTNDTC